MNNERQTRGTPTRGEMVRRIQVGVRRLTQQLHGINDAVGGRIDLQAGDLEVLDLIARDGPMSPRDVIAATGVHPATLTGLLDRLERGGWLVRRPDPDDRRRVQLEAAMERGGELARLYAPMGKALGAICAGYTPEELGLIADFLERTADAGGPAAAKIREAGS